MAQTVCIACGRDSRRRVAPGSYVNVKIEDMLECDLCGVALLIPEK